ncbi:hypothetical protein [Bacillus wiedmannii]|nr:hypothetical protein [Bacillus wiedmannii]
MGKEILFDNEGVILILNGVTGLLALKLNFKCLGLKNVRSEAHVLGKR